MKYVMFDQLMDDTRRRQAREMNRRIYNSVPVQETTSNATRVLVSFRVLTAKWWGMFSME